MRDLRGCSRHSTASRLAPLAQRRCRGAGQAGQVVGSFVKPTAWSKSESEFVQEQSTQVPLWLGYRKVSQDNEFFAKVHEGSRLVPRINLDVDKGIAKLNTQIRTADVARPPGLWRAVAHMHSAFKQNM